MYDCRIEKDSITWYGERLTTFVVTLPRIVLAELNTHKMLSKSSASSRAIPVATQIERLKADPFYPVHWGKNQKGMQADEELTPDQIAVATKVWDRSRGHATQDADELLSIGVHKQITNRLLEPHMWHTAIVSGTEWPNFFHLRDHKDAQPELQRPASMMNECYRSSRPVTMSADQWHLPFTTEGEEFEEADGEGHITSYLAPMVSAGRAARVSYLNQDGKRSLADDQTRATRCKKSGHMAPFEHVARPMTDTERDRFRRTRWEAAPGDNLRPRREFEASRWIATGDEYFLGNFNGWVQLRKMFHGERDMLAIQAK